MAQISNIYSFRTVNLELFCNKDQDSNYRQLIFGMIAVAVIKSLLRISSFTSFCHPTYFISYIRVFQEYIEAQNERILRI